MRRRFRMLIGVLVLCLWSTAATAIEIGGRVERLLGEASATGSSGYPRALQVGSTLLGGDRLATAPLSRLRLRLTDGAVLTLGGSTSLVIRAEPAAQQIGISLIEGTLQAESGGGVFAGAEPLGIDTGFGIVALQGGSVWLEQNASQLRLLLGEDGIGPAGAVLTTSFGTAELRVPGQGLTVLPGDTPAAPAAWRAEQLGEARDSVGFD